MNVNKTDENNEDRRLRSRAASKGAGAENGITLCDCEGMLRDASAPGFYYNKQARLGARSVAVQNVKPGEGEYGLERRNRRQLKAIRRRRRLFLRAFNGRRRRRLESKTHVAGDSR